MARIPFRPGPPSPSLARALILLSAAALTPISVRAQVYEVLHTFTGTGDDGANPRGTLVQVRKRFLRHDEGRRRHDGGCAPRAAARSSSSTPPATSRRCTPSTRQRRRNRPDRRPHARDRRKSLRNDSRWRARLGDGAVYRFEPAAGRSRRSTASTAIPAGGSRSHRRDGRNRREALRGDHLWTLRRRHRRTAPRSSG